MRHVTPATFALALGIQLDDVTAATTNEEQQQIPMTKDEAFIKLTGVTLDDILPEEYADYVRASRFVVRDLQFSLGQLGLVVNGRVSVMIPGSSFSTIPYLF